MKIMLMTDLEGVAGVLNAVDWIHPESCYYDQAKRLLTAEVNAVIAGFTAAGADEIVVVDGHGPGAINPELLDQRALLSRGAPRPTWPFGLDKSFDAYSIVGQHAKSRTPFSHLTHTGSFACLSMAINGYEIGEYGEMTLCARELTVPTIFAAGEEAFTREAEELTPGVVTVAVKKGVIDDVFDEYDAYSYERAKASAIHLAPSRARERLREGAFKAMQKFQSEPSSFRYKDFTPPYNLVIKMRAAEGRPPRTIIKTHPTSFIDLMNADS